MTADSSFRIGIDGYNLALPSGTGVATYGRNLAAAIARLGHPLDLVFGLAIPRKIEPGLRETMFFDRLGAPAPARLSWRRRLRRTTVHPFAHKLIEIPIEGRVILADAGDRLPRFDRLFNLSEIFDICARHFRRYGRFLAIEMAEPPAIMHWTYPLPIRLKGARNVYTLHDLVPLRLPRASQEDKRYYHSLIRACVVQADHIVTVSERSRTDLIDLAGADPSRVTNCYQSSALPSPRDGDLGERLRRLFDLERGEYLLFFAAIEPKKNLGRLIQAYLEADLQTPLIIVGSEAWNAEAELGLLTGAHGAALPGVARVRRIGHLPRPLLADLLNGARAMLFPALYEGFGLPALEALAAGIPLLASNTGALPEVVGEAALTIDPYDVTAMATAIKRLDGDAALRARLAAAGPAQAERFSLERFAARLAPVYHSMIAP